MWEEKKACKHKKLHYAELAEEVKQQGSSTKVCPIEVGSRGFVASSTIRLLKDLEIHGMAPRHTIKSVSVRQVKEAASGFAGLQGHQLNINRLGKQSGGGGVLGLQISTLSPPEM